MVDHQPTGLCQPCICRDPVTFGEKDDVSGYDLLGVYLTYASVTPDLDMVGQQVFERFDGLFRAVLLHEREHRVYEYNHDNSYSKVQQPFTRMKQLGYDAERCSHPEKDSQEMCELGKETPVYRCFFYALYLVRTVLGKPAGNLRLRKPVAVRK